LIVLDASVPLKVLLRLTAGVALEDRIFASEETLHAPHLLDVEVAQVLRRYALTGDVDAARCRAAPHPRPAPGERPRARCARRGRIAGPMN
jgi:predicted nucleic acid-binding protein